MEWEPKEYNDDPAVNATLNVAVGLHAIAKSLDDLFYALKYSKGPEGGQTISEELHHAQEGLHAIAEAMSTLGAKLPDNG